MTQPSSGGWPDPSSGQPSYPPPVDPTLPASAPPHVPSQPSGYDPYQPADPYAGMKSDPGVQQYPAADYSSPQPGYGGYPTPGYAYPAQQTNSMAIVALVLSLMGIASCITAPIGAIIGHVAMRQIRERNEGGEGMAKAAIIVGWILTGLMALVIVGYVVVIIIAFSSTPTV